MLILIRILMVLSFVLIPGSVRAQHAHDFSGAPLPNMDEFLKYFSPLPPDWQMSQFANPILPEEKKFSWWGYRHKELHDRGTVAELIEKSKPVNCCSGTDSGECRVTRYSTNGVGKRRVIIDDLECDISDDTKIVQLDTFTEQDTVVVCAGRTSAGSYKETVRVCPATYCIGGGKNGT